MADVTYTIAELNMLDRVDYLAEIYNASTDLMVVIDGAKEPMWVFSVAALQSALEKVASEDGGRVEIILPYHGKPYFLSNVRRDDEWVSVKACFNDGEECELSVIVNASEREGETRIERHIRDAKPRVIVFNGEDEDLAP